MTAVHDAIDVPPGLKGVVVTETAIPSASMTEKCVVVGRSGKTVPSRAVAVACCGSIEAMSRSMRAGSVKSFSCTPGNAGSPR